jgi:tetratricopeptide (TPR) repeat protein
MAIYYPIHVPLSLSVFIVCFVALAVITIWVLYNFRKRPYLFTSWFWYLGTLVPVVGLVQIGEQSMADRYTYLPSIGIAIGLVWLVGNEIQKRPALRIPLGVCAGVTGVIFLIGTWIQVNYWKDGLTLFKRTLEITENNWMIEQSYAMALEEVGDLDLAEKHALRVLEISPNRSDTCVLLGAVYLKKNQLDNAEMYLQKALQFNYNRPEDAYFYLGLVFTRQKKYDMAQEYLKRAMDRHFSPIMVLYALGEVYRDKGDFKQAFEMWQKVLTLDSTQTEAMTYLAWNMATCADPNQSNPSAAVEYAVQAAERTGYESASVLDVLAAAYARAGDFGRAVNTADRAIQIAEKKSLHDLIADIKKRKQCYEDKKAWVQEPR